MAVELVIKIDEDIYKAKRHLVANQKRMVDKVDIAIANGVPLPKGHGRILDEKDILDTENNDGGWYDLTDMPEYIAGVKPIIEAASEVK